MSKISLQGDPSGTGTFTVAAPNSNSNYTLTLPTSTGTVVVTGGAQTIEFAAGSASTPSITFTGDTNTGIFSPGADTIAFSEGGAEAMRIDSSGNVGIGTTSPSAGGTGGTSKVLQVDGAAGYGILSLSTTATADTSACGIVQFCSELGSDDRVAMIVGRKGSASTTVPTGLLEFYTANGGAVSERMRITSAGNVFIGRTSALSGYRFATTGGNINFEPTNGNTDIEILLGQGSALSGTSAGSGRTSKINFAFEGSNDNFYQEIGYVTTTANQTRVNSAADFYITTKKAGDSSSTERVRITSGGYFKASNSGTYQDAGSYHELRSNTSGNYIAYIQNTSANPYGVVIEYSGATPNGTSNRFLYCGDATAMRAEFRSNGGLANYSANDVNLSDRREKTNFAPAKNYLDIICSIPVQTFNYIDQSEDDFGLTLGVVAQDVQAIAPEFVMESDWSKEKDGSKMRLSIYQTDLQYALMKCIQELKAELDTVKAQNAAFEARLAALEAK